MSTLTVSESFVSSARNAYWSLLASSARSKPRSNSGFEEGRSKSLLLPLKSGNVYADGADSGRDGRDAEEDDESRNVRLGGAPEDAESVSYCGCVASVENDEYMV